VYPNFVSKCTTDIFEDGEDEYVTKLAAYAREKGYKWIDCSCGASIPSNRGLERDVLHCHPSFHSYPYLKGPWYDWAMVKWLYEDHNTEEYVHVAARLLLFGRLSNNENEFKPPINPKDHLDDYCDMNSRMSQTVKCTSLMMPRQ
jgi:hypothetical protein